MDTHGGMDLTPGQRWIRLLRVSAVLAGFGLMWLISPEPMHGFACPFHTLTGYSCLTCGLTRSLHAIVQGDVIASFRYHAMGPVILGGMIAAACLWFLEFVSGKVILVGVNTTVRKNTVLILAVTWILFGGIRLIIELVSGPGNT